MCRKYISEVFIEMKKGSPFELPLRDADRRNPTYR
jgi:hypothetical protein